MGRDFKTILNECLKELETGQPLEAILERYPEEADELRPLLLTAQNLKAMPIARPRSHVKQAGWQRFLGEANALRRARERRPVFGLWARPLLRPVAVAASLVLTLFFLGSGATVYAASSSLPDSPLYPIKLATEEARLWIVFDEDDRAGILLDQSETRMTEIRKLVQDGKPVESNVLSAMRGRMTRATDIINKRDAPQELVTRANELSAQQEDILIAIDESVPESHRDEYGKVLVVVHEVRIELQGLSESAPQLDPQVLAQGISSFTGLVEQREDDAWTIGGTKILVDEATIVEGDTGDVIGQIAQLTIISGPGGPQAIGISLRGSEELAKTATISGVIDKVDGSKIQLGGRTFKLDASTVIDAGSFVMEAGVHARVESECAEEALVEGVCRESELVAKRIVLLASEGPPETMTVEGVFQGQDDGSWIIAGIPIEFAPESPALITPPLGTLVEVTGSQEGQAMLVTTAESIRPPEELGLVKLEGVLDQPDDNQWQIGPTLFQTATVTRIGGELIPGARAVVWGLPNEDGSLDAIFVDVLDTRSLIAP
ncbi:MAG: hypothetical protein JSU97_03355 [Dehalococcoidia bacterium]|nr:MAG: hypothetical protein JSU97_03355 [Dehalococcoidia bacterium]